MVAVVTGGSVGVGRSIAQRLVDDGREVVITGRRRELLEKAASEIGARAIVCDATDPEDLAKLAAAITVPVEVLVNNAGGNRDLAAQTPTTLSDIKTAWLTNYEANVLSAVLTTAALDGHLASGGTVVNFGSIAGKRGRGSYGASKAALVAWAIDAGRTLGPRDITINTIAPGFIDDTDFFPGGVPDDRRAAMRDETMNGRVGVPDDISGLVSFLASPAARHITGQTLHVNGGALAIV